MISLTSRAAAPPQGGAAALVWGRTFFAAGAGLRLHPSRERRPRLFRVVSFSDYFPNLRGKVTKCEKAQEERLTKPPACGILYMKYTSWNLPENGAFVCLRKRFERRGREGKTRFVRRKPPCFRTERGGKRKRSVGAYEKDRSVDKKRRIAAYRRAAGRRAGRLRGNARGNAQSPPLRRRIRRICLSTNTAARRARRREWGR